MTENGLYNHQPTWSLMVDGAFEVSAFEDFSNITKELHLPEGGIGTTVLINCIICFLGLVAFFVCLKQLPLYKKRKSTTQLSKLKRPIPGHLLSRQDSSISSAASSPTNQQSPDDVRLFNSNINNINGDDSDNERPTETSMDRFKANCKRAFWGVWDFLFRSTEYEKMYVEYGRHVAVYLYFQKVTILAVLACTIIGLIILLPIHMTGNVPEFQPFQYGRYNFTTEDYPLLRTTISMVIDQPPKLYAHVFLSFIFVVVFALFMWRFNKSELVQRGIVAAGRRGIDDYYFNNENTSTTTSIIGEHEHEYMVSNYSVQVSKLPNDLASEKKLKSVFETLYPGQVLNVQILYDVSKRVALQEDYDRASRRLEHYERYQQEYGVRPNVYTEVVDCMDWCCGGGGGLCGLCCGMCCGKDAIAHYETKKYKLEKKISEWDQKFSTDQEANNSSSHSPSSPRAKNRSTGYAYVVFRSIQTAQQCRQRFAKKPLHIRYNINNCTMVAPVKISRAREPDDIIWSNIQAKKADRRIRTFFVHLFLFVFLIFFTTPLAIISGVQSLISFPLVSEFVDKIKNLILETSGSKGNILFQYLPTLFLYLVVVLLPILISWLSTFERYIHYSTHERINLIRMYTYLVLSTLVMPSAALTSIEGFRQFFMSDKDFRKGLQTMFVPQSGAFFINLVLQYAFLSNITSLMRLPDLIRYLYRRMRALTESEKQKSIEVAEFYFASEYAYYLSVLAITFTYSTFSPVIMPCGLFYMLFKHLVDRHNLTYVVFKNTRASHTRSCDVISTYMHTKLIITIALINVLIFQCAMVLFFTSKVYAADGSSYIPHLVLLVLGFVAMLIFASVWLQWGTIPRFLKFLKAAAAGTANTATAVVNNQRKTERNPLISADARRAARAADANEEVLFDLDTSIDDEYVEKQAQEGDEGGEATEAQQHQQPLQPKSHAVVIAVSGAEATPTTPMLNVDELFLLSYLPPFMKTIQMDVSTTLIAPDDTNKADEDDDDDVLNGFKLPTPKASSSNSNNNNNNNSSSKASSNSSGAGFFGEV